MTVSRTHKQFRRDMERGKAPLVSLSGRDAEEDVFRLPRRSSVGGGGGGVGGGVSKKSRVKGRLKDSLRNGLTGIHGHATSTPVRDGDADDDDDEEEEEDEDDEIDDDRPGL